MSVVVIPLSVWHGDQFQVFEARDLKASNAKGCQPYCKMCVPKTGPLCNRQFVLFGARDRGCKPTCVPQTSARQSDTTIRLRRCAPTITRDSHDWGEWGRVALEIVRTSGIPILCSLLREICWRCFHVDRHGGGCSSCPCSGTCCQINTGRRKRSRRLGRGL